MGDIHLQSIKQLGSDKECAYFFLFLLFLIEISLMAVFFRL